MTHTMEFIITCDYYHSWREDIRSIVAADGVAVCPVCGQRRLLNETEQQTVAYAYGRLRQGLPLEVDRLRRRDGSPLFLNDEFERLYGPVTATRAFTGATERPRE